MNRPAHVLLDPLPSAPSRESEIEVGLIGGFALRVDDESVDLPLSAQRLVAFLALNPGPLRRAFVAGTLWMDVSEQRAHARLRTALWRCSRPAQHLLKCTPTHVCLNAAVVVDVWETAALAESELGGHNEVGGCGNGERIGDALGGGGDLLPGWYEDWIEFKREGLRQQRLHALEARAHRLCEEGRYAAALQAGLAAVAADPLRESAHRALISTHLAEGNVAEAVRQYRRFAARLQADLGLTPTQRLTSLFGATDIGHLH